MKRIIIFCLALTLSSCSEIIDVDINTVESSLVIYGHLSSDVERQRIEISKSVAYLSTGENTTISSATVSVNDIYNYSFVDSLGYYLSDVAFGAEKDVDYTLKVNYDNQEYTATTTLADTTCITGGHLVKASLMGIGYYTPFLTSSGLKDEEYWYVYFTYEDSILLEGLSDVSIIQASTLIGSEPYDYVPFLDMTNVNAMFFAEEDREMVEKMFDSTSTTQPKFLATGDTIKISMCTITEGYYDFITVLNQSSGSSNPIFGSGAVFLPSNISNDAIGYFGSLNQKHIDIVVE
ncbi:MAG: DUF4249 family protein [Rikenellaceae bacterium]